MSALPGTAPAPACIVFVHRVLLGTISSTAASCQRTLTALHVWGAVSCVAANRHAADMEEPDRLPLEALLLHLSGLTNLTNLHISSQCKYSPSE